MKLEITLKPPADEANKYPAPVMEIELNLPHILREQLEVEIAKFASFLTRDNYDNSFPEISS